jgi:hypothetical protein
LCSGQPDFLIRIRDVKYSPEDRYTIIINGKTVCANEHLEDPLRDKLVPSEIAISTMVKNEKDRILEWIDYHLALGVDIILIYLNNSTDGTDELLMNLNNPKVIPVPFSYRPFTDWHYNEIQRMELCISSNIFRNYCKWICFIDIDEFIYIAEHAKRDKPMIKKYIRDFTEKYPMASSIDIYSFIFTNEELSYQPNQDVTRRCLLKTVKGKYPKIIVNSKYLSEFVLTPHDFNGAVTPPPESIYIGHYWIRPKRHPHAPFIYCEDIYRHNLALQNLS